MAATTQTRTRTKVTADPRYPIVAEVVSKAIDAVCLRGIRIEQGVQMDVEVIGDCRIFEIGNHGPGVSDAPLEIRDLGGSVFVDADDESEEISLCHGVRTEKGWECGYGKSTRVGRVLVWLMLVVLKEGRVTR